VLKDVLLACLFRTKLLRANVHFLSKPVVDGTTGTVIVLTTPDAQRTMLSYQVRKFQLLSPREDNRLCSILVQYAYMW